ncbi:MAG: radical SAM family heme chaperone HemW [Gammaproteobacteria bacterium]|nr:radical SAM family heme chaperone HemW [Gammaproteobacteria bacterium]MDH3373034.1 radical SAM family heme chaperone HemW [Gammaproteobacteria bacterium]MDH3408010.1 radical SAM family heme chaperone HemW [Gammaproteobacteria bacterium]MDH3551649.1 radical SAM family heme chaperone HemW [Gammaproteobacteria bacterium]
MQPPLSLYVHLPWCVRKCPYCDFNSHAAGNDAPRDRYVDALLTDLQLEADRAGGRELISIFLGGGTPSLFTPEQVARLLGAVERKFAVASDVEITLEANPGTVECGDPAGYRAAGVNRLSIGAQSFAPASLQTLGRIHGADDIGRAVNAARAAGFTNINLDLMYGLPEQTAAAAVLDIERAVDLEPQHLSWYQLTLEPNTVFYARPPAGLPDDDLSYEIQSCGQRRLAALGYEQYEVSAYAREGRQSVHNLNYWQFGDYLAAGAGAHGKYSDTTGVWRYAKPANPKQYMEAMERGTCTAELRAVPAAERLFEFMLNALRLSNGFDEGLFHARTGLAVDVLRERIEPAIEKGLIASAPGNFWRVTPLGQRFLNDLQSEFLPN